MADRISHYGIAAILGAPGPERGPMMTAFTTTGAPLHTGTGLSSDVIDPGQSATDAPNLVEDATPVTNGANGTKKFRRKYTNTSGLPFIAMRFRIVEITTRTGGAVPAGTADLRVLNSPVQTITLTDSSTVTSQALTLQTPAAQALGGGLNSSLGEGIITTTAPLANGASTYVEFNFGVDTDGDYLVTVLAEGLTVPPNAGASALDTFGVLPPPEADLSITKTDGVTNAVPGSSVTYTITASNVGPDPVTGATVADTFPASLTCTWTCVGAGGGICTASGSGNINDTVNLPAGGSTTYTASCTIDAAATGTLSNTATVSAPAGMTDPTPGNNSATDSDTILAPGALTVTPSAVGFGQIALGDTSAAMTVTLGNSGGVALSVTSLTAAAAPFAATGGSCGALPISIAGGASCTLDYTFTPIASGMASQTITADAGADGAGTSTLSGEGVQGVVGVSSATLGFGDQAIGSNTQQVLTITNTGTGPLHVTDITAALAPFAMVAGDSCGATPFTLAAGATCTVIYSFSPTMQGSFSQVITITADVGTAEATLSGRGAVTAAVLVPAGSIMAWLLLAMMLGGVVALRRRA